MQTCVMGTCPHKETHLGLEERSRSLGLHRQKDPGMLQGCPSWQCTAVQVAICYPSLTHCQRQACCLGLQARMPMHQPLENRQMTAKTKSQAMNQ